MSPKRCRPLTTTRAYGSSTTRLCGRGRKQQAAVLAGRAGEARCVRHAPHRRQRHAAQAAAHRVVPLPLALLVQLLVGAKRAVAVEEGGVQPRQRHVPHVPRPVGLRAEGHLQRDAPRPQVRLREQAQAHAPRVGRKHSKVGGALRRQGGAGGGGRPRRGRGAAAAAAAEQHWRPDWHDGHLSCCHVHLVAGVRLRTAPARIRLCIRWPWQEQRETAHGCLTSGCWQHCKPLS
jgi:hypothetical protein